VNEAALAIGPEPRPLVAAAGAAGPNRRAGRPVALPPGRRRYPPMAPLSNFYNRRDPRAGNRRWSQGLPNSTRAAQGDDMKPEAGHQWCRRDEAGWRAGAAKLDGGRRRGPPRIAALAFRWFGITHANEGRARSAALAQVCTPPVRPSTGPRLARKFESGLGERWRRRQPWWWSANRIRPAPRAHQNGTEGPPITAPAPLRLLAGGAVKGGRGDLGLAGPEDRQPL